MACALWAKCGDLWIFGGKYLYFRNEANKNRAEYIGVFFVEGRAAAHCTSPRPAETGSQVPPFCPSEVAHLSSCFFLVLWINL